METIYKTGNSINGPITRAIAINSWFGDEFIAIASASGELRASVVIVRMAYSEYVKFIFSDSNRSIIVFAIKNIINGMNIEITEFKLSNKRLPWLENIQKTAIDKNQISKDEMVPVTFSFIVSFKRNLVICTPTKGITITINIE